MLLTPTDFARIIGESSAYPQENGDVLIGRQSLLLRLILAMQETGEYTASDFVAVHSAYRLATR